jgi:NAD(P)-dependent dehydrogenase (short-subunit alcohol dehydrogenase family)
MANALVTGGGRGLGLALVRQLADDPSIAKLFVTTRGSPTAELNTIIDSAAKKVIHIKCEVVDTASVRQAAAEIEEKLDGEGLDILINNIGV